MPIPGPRRTRQRLPLLPWCCMAQKGEGSVHDSTLFPPVLRAPAITAGWPCRDLVQCTLYICFFEGFFYTTPITRVVGRILQWYLTKHFGSGLGGKTTGPLCGSALLLLPCSCCPLPPPALCGAE